MVLTNSKLFENCVIEFKLPLRQEVQVRMHFVSPPRARSVFYYGHHLSTAAAPQDALLRQVQLHTPQSNLQVPLQ